MPVNEKKYPNLIHVSQLKPVLPFVKIKTNKPVGKRSYPPVLMPKEIHGYKKPRKHDCL